MLRNMIVRIGICLVILYGLPAFGQVVTDLDDDSLIPEEKVMEYQHVLVLGVDRPFSKGFNPLSPVVYYSWFGDNFKNKDLYMQFTFTTTMIHLTIAAKTDRVFAGIRPIAKHTIYSAWRQINHGDNDEKRIFGGNDVGAELFFQYNWLKILSTAVKLYPTYHFYRMFMLTPNKYCYNNMPRRHWQVKPGVEIKLSRIKDENLMRIKHGYLLRVEYQYARRIGFGTWYDYDRLWFEERFNGVWFPPTAKMEGILYKDTVHSTHRLYGDVGAYYKFKHDINLQVDGRIGYCKGVDRHNAENIGAIIGDHAFMPGYAVAEFFHNFYVTSHVRIGFPIPFWDARIQPGFHLLYMPKKNEVVGLGRGLYYFGEGAVLTDLFARGKIVYHGYPKEIYTSVSCSFSLKLGNLLPMFIDYAYGIDALRAKSAHKVYLNKIHKGCHEVRVMFLAAFGSNVEKEGK